MVAPVGDVVVPESIPTEREWQRWLEVLDDGEQKRVSEFLCDQWASIGMLVSCGYRERDGGNREIDEHIQNVDRLRCLINKFFGHQLDKLHPIDDDDDDRKGLN